MGRSIFVHRQPDHAFSPSIKEPRLFIVAPCIQMEYPDKELSPNEEAHSSDTGDVSADVRSNLDL
jgi:hypothetical protein